MSTSTIWLVSLLALLITNGGCFEEMDLSGFTQSLTDLASNTLGVQIMQNHYNSLRYNEQSRNASRIAHELATQLSNLFVTQKEALRDLKRAIELIYTNHPASVRDRQECCHLQNLSSNYEFRVPVSLEHSCDRVSGIAESSARSVYGLLDGVYKRHNQPPLKWQYFGSEEGVTNQYPAGRAPDCSTYDHRFRPWYIASATPNPKDVVLIVKNNNFLSSRDRLFEAADIILRTLNPRDRVAVVIYSQEVLKPAISGCYAFNLSLATPANIRKFQYFLRTAPDPLDGNNMTKVLDTAYSYFVGENRTEARRDRAIVLFTDGERVESEAEQEQIVQLVHERTNAIDITVSLFIFTIADNRIITAEVRTFLQSLTTQGLYMQLPSNGDLRSKMATFYSRFSAQGRQTEALFLVPYYDLFGLDQLVMTISTPCYQRNGGSNPPTLVGVAAVDLTVADLFAGVEYFKEGGLSYAFVVDRNNLVIAHPLLPFPSSNESAVFIDISTLEPQPGFEEVRESMIRGGSGCMLLNTTQVLSRGSTANDGARTVIVPSNYCWKPINGTPFSLCVVIPQSSRIQQLDRESFSTPVNAHYHRLDLLAQPEQLCRHISQTATKNFSTVQLSPEAYARPDMYLLEDEDETRAQYIQDSMIELNDRMQILRLGVLDSVAATARAEDIWLTQTSNTQYVTWRYIATGNGVLRIYPGVYIRARTFNAVQRPWYQRAVSHLGLLAVSPPYVDGLGTGSVITLSQAILPASCDGYGRRTDVGDPSCVVLAVLGLDFTHFRFSKLLYSTVPACEQTGSYRCLIIDSNAYVVTHPYFVANPDRIVNKHLSELEPLVAQDMVMSGFLRRVYCNNFQYNFNFTRRPRKQYSYEVTEMVSQATTTLNGGYGTNCIFYKIAPVVDTNIFLVAVDLQLSLQSLCSPVSCPCSVDQSCTRLPSDCNCPCSEDIQNPDYNPCLESFERLSAPACPTRFGVIENGISTSLGPSETNISLSLCFMPNCSQWNNQQDCQSAVGCDFCEASQSSNDSIISGCRTEGTCPTTAPSPTPSPTVLSSTSIETWYAVTAVLLVLTTIAILLAVVFAIGYSYERTKQKSCHSMAISEQTRSPHNPAELESLTDTTTDQKSGSCRTQKTFVPASNGSEGATGLNPPESLIKSTDGFSDLFTVGQGSLNPSHAGGIWF